MQGARRNGALRVASTQNALAVKALRLATEPHWAALAFSGAHACAYDWIADGDILTWLGDPQEAFGLSPAPTTRAALLERIRQGSVPAFHLEAPASSGREVYAGRYVLAVADDAGVMVEDRGVVLRGDDGQVERLVGVMFRIENDGERHGHLDRGQMRDAIDAAIDWSRAEGAGAALLMASIDALGAINDAYGLDVADEVISEAAARIGVAIGMEGAVGRVGGNKFAILLLDCDAACIETRAGRIRDCVQESLIQTSGGQIAATMSIGALALPSGAANSEVAIRRAEVALGQAKKKGRSNFTTFDASPEREAARRRKAACGAEVIDALRADRFRLAYQPLVCARTGRVDSYEALIRMIGRDGAPVPAGDFIPVAEELGLVRDLDRRVLELASVALRRAPALRLAVNISGMSVGDEGWISVFERVIAIDRSLASRLTVEVTETAARHDIEEGIRFVRWLRAQGCRVAIDDFGAGYTSFRNLQTLDLNCVKIDGSFVKGITRRPDSQAFVRTLVSLAKTFNLEVVAEWVGSREEAVLLRALGVDKFQGAFYGMPEMTPPWDRAAGDAAR